jgi:hypothetical protein
MLSMTFGDVTSVLDSIPGVNTITTYIENKAKTGAQAAIPDIQAQVQTAVLPYVLIALVLGAGGLALGLKAYKRKPAAALSGRRYRR